MTNLRDTIALEAEIRRLRNEKHMMVNYEGVIKQLKEELSRTVGDFLTLKEKLSKETQNLVKSITMHTETKQKLEKIETILDKYGDYNVVITVKKEILEGN